jgi:hypothetical protein
VKRGKRCKVISGIIHPRYVTMANTPLGDGEVFVGLPVSVSHVLAYLYHLLHQGRMNTKISGYERYEYSIVGGRRVPEDTNLAVA